MQKFYLTTPIYYVNDVPHIGSAYTTIAADVLARFYRLGGADVFFLTGTAEHGTKIARSAKQAGREPQPFVDEMSAKFSLAWDILEVAPDDFIRTSEPRHVAAVKQFFEKLQDSGKIYEGDYEGLYCVGHEAFLKESDLTAEGLCPDHKTKPETVRERNWFFKLSEYGPALRERIETGQFLIEPEVRKNEILSFIRQGLEDITISRQQAEFAIPLPWDERQTIYVWLDELFNYCSAIGYGRDEQKFRKYWPADLHLMGKDITRFHCIIWPALLLAVGLEPPKRVFAHGYFTVNGQKMSKTLGNVIDPVAMAEKYGPDALRYFLLREVPFGADGDVSEAKLAARYEGDLANGLGNLFSRLTTLIATNLNGEVPEIAGSPREFAAEVDGAIRNLRFHDALARLWEEVAWANKYIDETKLWEQHEKNPKLFGEVVANLVALLLEIAKKLAPFMPETAEKIRAGLSAEKIEKAEPLFPRL